MTTTLSTLSLMVAGRGASGSQLASGIAGGWPPQTDPRLAIRSGVFRGSSGVDQGDLEPPGTSGLGTCWCFLVAALGVARVRVHGLVDCVRDGVLLYVPWWKVTVNMQPKLQQSLPTDRQWMMPFPFIDRVLDIAGMLQRQVCTALSVQRTVEIPQLQFLDLVVVPVLCNDKFGYRQCRKQWNCRKCSSCGVADITVIIQLIPAVQVARFSRDSVRQSAGHSSYAHSAVLEQGC